MDFTIGPSLIIGILFGMIGFVYFVYGKKMSELDLIIAGLLLCAYPYFVSGVFLTIVIGIILSLGPFIVRRYF